VSAGESNSVEIDGDVGAALEVMQGIADAVLHSTPPEKVGILLRDHIMAFVLVLELARKVAQK
jgi:hypothetical protein